MRSGIPTLTSLARALAMLEAIIADGGKSGVAAIARSIGMPVATAHRQASTLLAEGYLGRAADGRLRAGPRLLALMHRIDEKQVIASAAVPVLHELASHLGSVVQLGTFENDMVTYRLKTGHGAGSLFTREGMQLEAYCSGVGKVLLAFLPDHQRRAYLAGGPFVALTRNTITAPDQLARALDQVRQQGFAIDDEEVSEGLYCVAVPVFTPGGSVPAALSASFLLKPGVRPDPRALAGALRAGAGRIAAAAFG